MIKSVSTDFDNFAQSVLSDASSDSTTLELINNAAPIIVLMFKRYLLDLKKGMSEDKIRENQKALATKATTILFKDAALDKQLCIIRHLMAIIKLLIDSSNTRIASNL